MVRWVLTPNGHKRCKKYGRFIVKEMSDSRVVARLLKEPVIAFGVALWAHQHGTVVAYLLADLIGEHRDEAIDEANQTDESGRNQHVSVEAEPGKVHGDLGSKVFADIVQWLMVDPLSHRCPVVD